MEEFLKNKSVLMLKPIFPSKSRVGFKTMMSSGIIGAFKAKENE